MGNGGSSVSGYRAVAREPSAVSTPIARQAILCSRREVLRGAGRQLSGPPGKPGRDSQGSDNAAERWHLGDFKAITRFFAKVRKGNLRDESRRIGAFSGWPLGCWYRTTLLL